MCESTEIFLFPAPVKEFLTPASYSYTNYRAGIGGATWTTFLVRACNDAHFGLMENVGDTIAYEVIIGGSGNTRTAIRRNRQTDEVAVETPDILDCNVMKPFWVSWIDGYIQVGNGAVYGDDVIASWQDGEPLSINHAAISTWDTAEGYWQISNYPS